MEREIEDVIRLVDASCLTGNRTRSDKTLYIERVTESGRRVSSPEERELQSSCPMDEGN